MSKVRELVSSQVSRTADSVRGEDHQRVDRRRRVPHGEELRVELRSVRVQRRILAISTALLVLACVSLGVWAWSQQTASNAALHRKQAKINELTDQLAAATTGLEESRRDVDSLVVGRIPGLLPFEIDKPIHVDETFVREISFTPAAPPVFGYECKLVVENDSNVGIRPALTVHVFDKVGIELAQAQITDGILDELRADEIRSFFANLEILEGSVPRYFLLTSD